MSIALCTIVLNEMEWLPKLWEQHRGWPGLKAWVFVEGADENYTKANPSMVRDGLSVDGTTEFLESICGDGRVVYARNQGSDKCAMRNACLRLLNHDPPDFYLNLDADEFYMKADQPKVEARMRWSAGQGYDGTIFRYRHLWRPPSMPDWSPFAWEVRGGFWAIPHCHGWRWQEGMRHDGNHMNPSYGGQPPRMVNLARDSDAPQCVHMAFASELKGRRAKHAYYVGRGEGVTDHRGWYVESRAAWETWLPGAPLPRGAQVLPYEGPIPEVFDAKSS